MAEHRGTRAIARLVEFAPSTGGLALWAHHHDLPQTSRDAAPIATDGQTIFYGVAFEQLPLPEQAGLVAHEVLHLALRHPHRLVELRHLLGDVDRELFTVCADALVNSALSHLSWLRLPAGAVTLELLLEKALGVREPVEVALLQWDVERLYRAIDDRRPSGRQGARRGGRSGSATGDRDDGPRAAQARALGGARQPDLLVGGQALNAPEAEAELAREWRERLVRGHAGDGAHSMLRTLLADLPTVRTPWQQVLRTVLARALAPSPGLSWSRPSRSYLANQGRIGRHRLPWEPGTSASRAVPKLVVIVDVSGSIDAALLERFSRELEAILRRLEAGLVVIVGDDRVRRVERFAPGTLDLASLTFDGGGGTDFTPLLLEADQHDPDLVVVLTDLDGPARVRPRWPVWWAVPERHAMASAPFGRKLTLTD